MMMWDRLRYSAAWAGVGLLVLVCAGCAEFADDPLAPRATRAVKPFGEKGDAAAETMRDDGPGGGGLNLLTVTFPNNRNERPQVSSILDPIAGAAPGPAPAATQSGSAAHVPPPNAPAAANPAMTERPVPANGASPVRVVSLQKPADAALVSTDNQGNVTLMVTCPSGIGSLVLERTGEFWPAVIHVTLRYGDRAFTTLEGFTAAEITAGDQRLELKSTVNKAAGKADVAVPGFTRSQRIRVEWVDAYR